jgi:hypothetical protein
MREIRVTCALCSARGSILRKRAILLPKGLVYICDQDFHSIIASADRGTLTARVMALDVERALKREDERIARESQP